MPVDALLLQGPNDAFDYPVLLRTTVLCNELLLQAVTSDELLECKAGKNKAIAVGNEVVWSNIMALFN